MRTCKFVIFLILCTPGFLSAQDWISYKSCRSCHSDIFNLWSGSLHAKSSTDPSFQAAFMDLAMNKGAKAGQFCLRCHAPIANLTGEYDLNAPSVVEGVTCWFCHSVSSVEHGENIYNYYNLDTTGTLYGPHKDCSEDKHKLVYSPLHLTADLCAGCHEYVNENGVGVLETFSEWSESPYPKSEIYCQNCHMPIMADMTAVDGQENGRYFVTAHEFQGGHSNINLANAVKLETAVEKDGKMLDVTVSITNAESGHKLPTGIPIRKIVLNVSLKTGNNMVIRSARKVYRKVLTDKFGTIIENSADMFMEATAIYSDNRIAPQETRVEKFSFALPDRVKDYFVEATLDYEYSRKVFQDELVKTQMAKNQVRSGDIK